MKMYAVRFSITEQYTYHVEAENPEAAEEAVREGLLDDVNPLKEVDYAETNLQLVDVEELQ